MPCRIVSTSIPSRLADSIDYMLTHKRTWFAIGWNIEIRRIPKMFEEISVKTWAYEFATSIGLS
ncbi:MAG: hypothetical protein ACLSHP_01355 [Coprococcus sp.]